ncbi:hypothetical protein [Sporolactobacillus spathodeae]|uniref:RsiW-degrading membrane proteinase PrsW (M82 family) n=1 Tax=Sporolactobacillus spathodeae TaxID=1465502 RepID=A0ABS2Q6Y9_9BACL|nr:hypothetical protein [Sporolactobacillus spathodeae]MBM7657165.1 RsiW-degrading membrane proteinase PrsW (M82 family) [Sporolactobacillus spathodeae]
MKKKITHYLILFAVAFVLQWIWYSYIKPRPGETLVDMLLTAVVFAVIVFLLDLLAKKKHN